MPRLITRNRPATEWVPIADERQVPVGTRVCCVPNAGFIPFEGVVTAQFWDAVAQAYLVAVATDTDREYRLVAHPVNLLRLAITDQQIPEEAPACSDCGQPSYGEGGDPLRAFCDECAVDLDVLITPWEFVIEAQLDAETEASESSPRRARQRRERQRRIRNQEPEPPPEHVSSDHRYEEIPIPAEPDNAATVSCGHEAGYGHCVRGPGHLGWHHGNGVLWDDDGELINPPTIDQANYTIEGYVGNRVLDSTGTRWIQVMNS